MSENTPVGFGALFGDGFGNVNLSDVLPLLAPGSHARIAYCAAEKAEAAAERAFAEFDDELPKKPSDVALFFTLPADNLVLEEVYAAAERLRAAANPGANFVFGVHPSSEIEKSTAVIIAADFK